ncbi:hypothetical protein [Leucobacter coleopterorum]|uniref:hypothetical protein n=1 Tax=Leucobacter coleopterorum TaxID=2714933 RepID=UPI00197D61FD|nr:hypothetical protein [Leucobacter coleopterorum]
MLGDYWLRNNSGEAAFLTVQLLATGLTEGTNDFVSLAARVDGREFASVSLNDDGCATVVQGLPIASGAIVQLGASVALSIDAPLELRGQRADLNVRTTLHDADFDPAPGQCLADGGSMPDTPQTVPPGKNPVTPQKPQSQVGQEQAGSQGGLAATGTSVGGWLLLVAAMTAGGILLRTQRKGAINE